MDSETFDKLIASPQCRYDHDDPRFMDCFEARCDHIDHFGCRCAECNEEHATAFYSESPREYDSAIEESSSECSMENHDARQLPQETRAYGGGTIYDFECDPKRPHETSLIYCDLKEQEYQIEVLHQKIDALEKTLLNDRSFHKRQTPSPGAYSRNTSNKRPRPPDRHGRQFRENDHDRRTIMEFRPREREKTLRTAPW